MAQRAVRNNRMTSDDSLRASWTIGPAAHEVEAQWLTLEARSDCSFFQSWAWTGCLYGERFPDPVLLTVTQDGIVKALALFNRDRKKFYQGRLLLGESGRAPLDSVFIEHNGPIFARDSPEALQFCFRAMVRDGSGFLSGRPIMRSVILSGIGDAVLEAARRAGSVRLETTRQAPAIDLARLRRHGQGILDNLSAGARYQLRRSIRHYEKSGPIAVHRAETIQEAERFLAALAEWHGRTWAARGCGGAFAEAAFYRFHSALIGRGLASGMVDVLKIAAGPRVIGYLLNFVYKNHVHAYQSGFDYAVLHPHEKPGLTCHYAASRNYLGKDMAGYDFLAGDDRYKESFADHAVPLHWARLAPRFSIPGGAYRLRSLAIRHRERGIIKPVSEGFRFWR